MLYVQVDDFVYWITAVQNHLFYSNYMKYIRCFILILVLGILGLYPSKAYAFEMRAGSAVTVEKTSTISGSLFASGSTIDIQGTVNGDVYCAGQHATISGFVDGDVLCTAQTIDITGTVNGNVRVAAQTLTVSGLIKRNASVVGQSVVVASPGVISGELFAGAQSMSVAGAVGKTLSGAAQSAQIDGKIGGNVDIQSDNLQVGSESRISGNFLYTSKNPAQISNAASISGTITHKEPEVKPATEAKRRNPIVTQAASNTGRIAGVLFSLLVGFFIMKLWPKATAKIVDAMTDHALPTWVTGFFSIMIIPTMTLFLILTIIGIPVAILVIMTFIVTLWVSKMLVGMWLGKYLFESVHVGDSTNPYVQYLVGYLVLWFIFQVPFLGGLLSFLAVTWGLGGLVYLFRNRKKK